MTFISDQQPEPELNIKLQVNGQPVHAQVSVRQHLGDFLRESQGFKGTHIGCEHGVCGACTVRVDGRAVRSCLTLAVQADAAQVFTIEGLSDDLVVRALQDSFVSCHAMQCGFAPQACCSRPRNCCKLSLSQAEKKCVNICRATIVVVRVMNRLSMR